MVIIKKKIGKQEIVSINSFSSLYALFDEYPALKMGIKEGEGEIKIHINDDPYPNNQVERFENYGNKALIKYRVKKLKNYEFMQIFENKERGIIINNIITNTAKTRRKISFSFCISLPGGEGREEKIRDAYYCRIGESEYIIGVKSTIKNIEAINKIKNGKREKEIYIKGEINVRGGESENIALIIANNIDDYDYLYLHIPTTTYILDAPSTVRLGDKSIEKLYAFSTHLLSSIILDNHLWDILRLLVLREYEDAKKTWRDVEEKIRIKEVKKMNAETLALLKIIHLEFSKVSKYNKGKILMKKINKIRNLGALALIDEKMLGNSIYHTITLAYDLIQKKHYEEGYKLLVYFANTMYDLLLFSPPQIEHSLILKELTLFMLVTNNLFFDVRKRGKEVWCFMPDKYIGIENKKLNLIKGWAHMRISRARYGLVANLYLTLSYPLPHIDLYIFHKGKKYYKKINIKKKGEVKIKDIFIQPIHN